MAIPTLHQFLYLALIFGGACLVIVDLTGLQHKRALARHTFQDFLAEEAARSDHSDDVAAFTDVTSPRTAADLASRLGHDDLAKRIAASGDVDRAVQKAAATIERIANQESQVKETVKPYDATAHRRGSWSEEPRTEQGASPDKESSGMVIAMFPREMYDNLVREGRIPDVEVRSGDRPART